ncbi:transcriptional regulator [Flavobacterium sp. UMI-01]|uniref:SRPBCC family protein n=1 Tax=Flavobacterium sp. UMI-01 TaxID=1441053 RepID=UPI001C7D4F3C|nr:transcriptional regulator [Flavobacterium sp. UMI-01]
MRILKYLILLVLLSLVALSIFIATQKGEFNIERSKVINSSKSSVYNYVNDLKNWEDFGSWMEEDPQMRIVYAPTTIGPGASYTWEGKDGHGEMKTLFVKENDSIAQKMTFNDSPSSVSWHFKDTVGGTKVTWKTSGKMNFFFKIYAALNGGPDHIIGEMYEKSLNNLDKALDYEINTYSIKESALVKRPNINYIGQSFTCEIAKVYKNAKIVIPKVVTFCQENNLTINGKPFIIYHNYDLIKKITKVSICLPIKTEIFISPGSDLSSGRLEATEAVKTVLTGDYSHMPKAINKGITFLNKNQIKADPSISHIEWFVLGRNEIKNPSKWVTEVYLPLVPKAVAPKASLPVTTNTETAGGTEEESANTPSKPTKVQSLQSIKPAFNKIEPKKNVIEKKEEPSEF